MIKPFHIKRAEYVEIQIPAGNTKQTAYFPDLPNLRTSKIFGIEVHSSNTQPKTYSGATNQAVPELKNTILVLYFDGGEFIQVPALTVMRLDNAPSVFMTFGDIPMLSGQNIVWAKSYIFYTDPATIGNISGKNYCFSVYYEKNNI